MVLHVESYFSSRHAVDAVRGLMNVMCTQLMHIMHHVIPRGWEEGFSVEVGSSPIQGSRFKFLRSLIEGVQKHFNEPEWCGGVALESWVEVSSCSCERLVAT